MLIHSSEPLRLKPFLRLRIGWWALTFPMGVFFMGCLGVANLTDSDGFRVVSEMIGASMILLWVCVFSMTIFRVFTGELFRSACASPTLLPLLSLLFTP